MDRRRAAGNAGEDRAVAYLKKQGYEIVGRNWRNRFGELDIIARQGKELVFVEVRTIESPFFGFPEESVGPSKQRKLANLAAAYLQANPWEADWRIDVIAIDSDGLRHVKSAVSLW